jgi:hydrogenase nickel incorporation protein HypB
MCETCGCGDPAIIPVDVQRRILDGNDRVAAHNREHFAEHGVLAVNLMGAPGSGKTALLEATARRLPSSRLGALTGDLETDRDEQRLHAAGIRARTITTVSACHLDAAMVHRALHEFALAGLDYLFIENVGNLVCPAVYDLGQTANVVALSVTEGDDKPLKYPVIFNKADLVVLTKVDLLPHLRHVSVDSIQSALEHVMPRPAMVMVSAFQDAGLDDWIAWLADRKTAVGIAVAGAAR